MNIYIMGNIFSEEYSNRIICQQVNCQGKMGSGLAKAIKDKYPKVFTQYMRDHKDGLLNLGYVSYIDVDSDNIVANICGQEYYGYDGAKYTDDDALYVGLSDVFDTATRLGYDVVIPYKIGCGLGGGDWEAVIEIINEIFQGEGNIFHIQGGCYE